MKNIINHNSTKCPTLRIEWIQTTDMLPTFINSLPGWQKRKIYDYIRDYCIAVDTSDNKIHHFYYQYNNDDGNSGNFFSKKLIFCNSKYNKLGHIDNNNFIS